MAELQRFCAYVALDFTPLGGNRPDCAVVASAVSSMCDTRLPWDVLDVCLAALCAPLIFRSANNIKGYTVFLCTPRVSLRLRTTTKDDLEQIRQQIGSATRLHLKVELDESLLTAALPVSFLSSWGALETIDLRRSTKLHRIGADFLSGCEQVTSVILPESLTETAKHFLSRCKNLQRIDLKRTSLQRTGSNMLYMCERLTSVELPGTLTNASAKFMYGCAQLEQIDLRNTALQRADDYFLNDCGNLTSVQLPHSLTEIADFFLCGCLKLEHVDLRDTSVRCVGEYFLKGIDCLTSVMLPDVLSKVSDDFLSKCPILQSIDLRNTRLQTVGSNFASKCCALSTVHLPDGVTEVGHSFLEECRVVDVFSSSAVVLAAAAGRHFVVQ